MQHGADHPATVDARRSGEVPTMTEAEIPGGVVARLRHMIEAVPDRLAVADDDEELTLRALAERAAAVQEAVRATVARLGGPVEHRVEGAPGGPDPVALLHPHRVNAVAAIMGVVTSGHPLLVLDTRTPAARLRQFIAQAGVRVVVCDESMALIAGEIATEIVVIGRDTPAVPVDRLWENPPDPTSIATLGFTSGTTGRPKLVALDHRFFAADVYGESVFTDSILPQDRMAHTLPLAFSAGMAVTIASVLIGTELRLFDARERGIGAFQGWMGEQKPTLMYASPALLRAMLRTDPERAPFSGLRAVMLAGEASYPSEIEPLRALLPPDCFVKNSYGSSEGGLLCTYPLRAEGAPLVGALPAGPPAYGREIVIVDDEDRPVSRGESGIVTFRCSSHLFSGYWLNPEATAATIGTADDGVPTYRTSDVGRLDDDGVLHLMGRRDHTVKIRGHLVDPAEVDTALFALPEVREAIVVGATRDNGETKRLVAYVVPAADQPSPARLRASLRGVLPGYMVPETVVYLDTLPRTERGKIDRAQLPPAPPRTVDAADQIPLTRWEEMVASIWIDVLELEAIGRHEDFFELGGDSLAAEALLSRVIGELGVSEEVCTTSLLVAAPTVADFAARLRGRPAIRRGPLIPLHRAGTRPPVFFVAGGGGLGIAFVPWARLLGPDQPTWALQCASIEARGLPERSVKQIARSHLAAIRSVQPHGPYYFAGHSFGAVVALEMAHQLKAVGEEVGMLAIIDSFPPDRAAQPPMPRRAPIQKVRDLAGVTLMSVLSTPGGRDHWRFLNHSARLAARYTCPPWDGRTLVIVAQSDEKDLRSRWAGHLTGTWRMIEVPGDHLSITRLPWAERVADELRAEMDAARSVHA